MGGDQNHGFDLVMEIGAPAVQDLIGTFFSDNDIPCSLVAAYSAALGLPSGTLGTCEPFVVTVILNRPTDVPLPAGAVNPIDVTVRTGGANSGTSTRMVVGVDVDGGSPGFDIVVLDVANKLYFAAAQLTIGGVTTPFPGDAVSVVEANVPPMALLPVPVTRGSADCKLITAADATVIDDTTAANRDAVAILLTMGGGAAGNKGAFANSFIPGGSDGAFGLAFLWLCRCLSERLTNELNLPAGSFTNCRLQRKVRIDDAREVDLTELTIDLQPPRSLAVHAKVTKEGFCYEAKGTVGARITLAIEYGNLTLSAHVDSPDIDIDIPWYCWVAAVIIAAVTGVLTGFLGTIVEGIVVGVLVGGILTFLLWLLSQVVTGTVAGVTDAVKQALGNVVQGIEIPLLGMDISLDNITVDDISLGFQVMPISSFPVRSEGELYVPNDHACDFDSGSVGPPSLSGADVLWAGAGKDRKLSTICASKLARTGSNRFEDFSRYTLGTLAYSAPASIPYDDFVQRVVVDTFFFEFVEDRPTFAVFGFRTDEQRLSAIQVVKITEDGVWLRYRTYEDRVPSVRIDGGFACVFPGVVPAPGNVEFVPLEPVPIPGFPIPLPLPLPGPPGPGPLPISKRVAMAGTDRQAVEMRARAATEEPRAIAEAGPVAVVGAGSLTMAGVGTWLSRGAMVQRRKDACFRAVSIELVPPLAYGWALGARRLVADAGSEIIEGGSVDYTGATSDTVCLRLQANQSSVDFELEVTVIDAERRSVRASRCIRWDSACGLTLTPSVDWLQFRSTYLKQWGIQRAIERAPREQLAKSTL